MCFSTEVFLTKTNTVERQGLALDYLCKGLGQQHRETNENLRSSSCLLSDVHLTKQRWVHTGLFDKVKCQISHDSTSPAGPAPGGGALPRARSVPPCTAWGAQEHVHPAAESWATNANSPRSRCHKSMSAITKYLLHQLRPRMVTGNKSGILGKIHPVQRTAPVTVPGLPLLLL